MSVQDRAENRLFREPERSVLKYVSTGSGEKDDLQAGIAREYGGETGSTRVVKTKFLPGMIPPLSGHFTNANDNVDMREVAVAA